MEHEQRAKGPDALAALMHEAWCAWMSYVFAQAPTDDYGQLTIPADIVRRWEKRKDTPFGALSEPEKTAYRIRTARIIALFGDLLAAEYAGVPHRYSGPAAEACQEVLEHVADYLGIYELGARAKSLEE